MKHLVLVFSLFTVLLLNFVSAAQVNAAQPPKISDDAAIRATIADYIEGYFTGDATRMERSLHPHYLKHTISGLGSELKITDKTGLEMVQGVRSNGPEDGLSGEKVQISVLDIAGDIASAKLVTARWVDYMTLAKWNGEWKIVSVVLRRSK